VQEWTSGTKITKITNQLTKGKKKKNPSVAQINDHVLKDLSFPFETGGQQELTVVYGNWRKGSRCLDVQLLETNKLTLLGIPAVHLGERVIAAQDGILPATHSEGLEYHGASRGHSLQLSEEGPVPVHHLGVTNEARQADIKVRLDLEMLHGVNVLHLWDVGASVKLLGGFVPLVNDGPLGAAGQDQVRFRGDLQVFHISVAVPGVEGLMGVEAIAVPMINAGGACLGTVCYNKVPLSIQLEGLHKVRFPHPTGVYVLDLYKALWVLFPPVFTGRKSVYSQRFSI